MRTLETSFCWTGDGFANNPRLLTQVKRSGRVALYRRTKEANGATEGYEVIIIRVKPEQTMWGNLVPEREIYASVRDFGSYGKFCATLGRAEQVFSEWARKESAK